MSDYSDVIDRALIDPWNAWVDLDSFWREQTAADTRALVQFQLAAARLLQISVLAQNEHRRRNRLPETASDVQRVPWFPLVIQRSALVDNTVVLYGSGLIYDSPPEALYGGPGDPALFTRLVESIVDLPLLCDAVRRPSVVADQTQFSFEQGKLVFSVDPFTLFPVRTDSFGIEYTVLWVRNIGINSGLAFNDRGWIARFRRSGDYYTQALAPVWETLLQGPSLGRYLRSLIQSAGQVTADCDEVVRYLLNDGYQQLVQTDSRIYRLPLAATVAVAPGDRLYPGLPLTQTFRVLDLQPPADVSGVLLQLPLSTGEAAELTFANQLTDWTFDALRPSPWRFPIGGDPAQVEQFWVDTADRLVLSGQDLAVIYGLPAQVNPLRLLLGDLIQSRITFVAVELADLQGSPSGAADRLATVLPPGLPVVLWQQLGGTSDIYDVGTNTSSAVGYGYNTEVPTEVVSTAGTDLLLGVQTPLVTVS